jgi:leucyl aminopeptidase
VLAFDDANLDALTEAMHEKHDRCGGYMVHDTLEDAFAEAVPERTMEYTLDRAAAVKAVLPAIDTKRIYATIAELSANKNRYYMSASGARASVWLRDRWRGYTSRPDVTVELMDHGYEQASVIMTIPGTTRANEVVVIGGHLDSIAPGGINSNAPGADDDASGVATFDEVARVLLAKDVRFERTVKFIAYAAEEVGLRGSLSVVREFKKQKINVVGALQLDMTNYQGSDKDIWLIKDYTSAKQNMFLVNLIEAYTGSTWGWDACGYACSDHASWHRAGVPASMPFEARFRDMNNGIHTAKDTLDRSNQNAEHAVKFARLATAYAIELAKGEVATMSATKTDDSCCFTWLAGLSSLALAFVLWFRTSRVA